MPRSEIYSRRREELFKTVAILLMHFGDVFASCSERPPPIMNPEAYRYINGVPVLVFCPEANVRSAMEYEPQENDVIIVTYPKCGTTWTQYIVSNILSKANTPVGPVEYMLFSPFIDLLGDEAARSPARGGPLMTHLPLKSIVFSNEAKYIYVARNPYDCIVSSYYFLRNATQISCTDLSFATFLDTFLSGTINYGDYFDHLLPWYKIRHESNVLFFTFEELKKSTRDWVLRIADFLGKEHGAALREDEALLAKILELSSLENMKAVFNYSSKDRFNALRNLPSNKSLKSFEAFKESGKGHDSLHDGSGFARRGVVGDWKRHFTGQQITKVKDWIENKTTGTDVMNLWKECGLP